MNWHTDIEQKPWANATNLRIWRASPDRIEVLQPFQFKSYDRSTKVPDDEIAMVGGNHFDSDSVHSFLKAMMDAAWKLGIRPAGFEDHHNELKAVRDHLADMRALALRKEIGPPSPQLEIDMSEALRRG